jgi:hypothetical protein
MSNLPLFVLFWTSVPLAIYRSPHRWRTFFVMLGTWFAAMVGLVVLGAAVRPNVDPQQLGNVLGQIGELLAIFAAVWHSQRTRKNAAAPPPPSVIV